MGVMSAIIVEKNMVEVMWAWSCDLPLPFLLLLRSVRVGTIVDLETRNCRLRVLLINGTGREGTTGDKDELYG